MLRLPVIRINRCSTKPDRWIKLCYGVYGRLDPFDVLDHLNPLGFVYSRGFNDGCDAVYNALAEFKRKRKPMSDQFNQKGPTN